MTGNSLFEDNSGSGITIYGRGAIAIKTKLFESSGNGGGGSGYGAFVNNDEATAPQSISFTGVNRFNDNASGGLRASSEGAISLANVTASSNQVGAGGYLFNEFVDSTGGITLSGVNAFNHNDGSGLEASSLGPITINSLTADDNGQGGFGYGAYLVNSTAATPQPVKLTGSNQFHRNDYTGLEVGSIGAISLNNLSADGSLTGSGAVLNNTYSGGSGGINLTGANSFLDNYRHGLYAASFGAIASNNLTANGNGFGGPYGYGAYLETTGAATPQAIKLTGSSTFDGNYNGGLYARASGAVSANDLTARNTASGAGVELGSSTAGQAIAITGTNLFTGNLHYGLFVASLGNVSLSKVTANDNGIYGLYVNTSGDVTLTCGSFTSNTSYGMYVVNAPRSS